MGFFTGFLTAWFVLGTVALIGFEREWYTSRIGFWAFLTFPVYPVARLVVAIRDYFYREG